MDAYKTIISKRAVRHFTGQPVPEEVLNRVLEAGRWTGSSRNKQPWRFIVVRSPGRLEQLATCGRYSSHLRQASFAIVIVTKSGHSSSFDAGRVAQNMMLAAWAHNVGSCIALLHHKSCAQKVLQLPAGYEVQAAISFGYPDENAPKTIEGKPREAVLASVGRRILKELVSWDVWMGEREDLSL